MLPFLISFPTLWKAEKCHSLWLTVANSEDGSQMLDKQLKNMKTVKWRFHFCLLSKTVGVGDIK